MGCTLSNDSEEYLAEKHFSVEGHLEFWALLFLSQDVLPLICLETLKKKKEQHHVLRMENCEELIPEYLMFI